MGHAVVSDRIHCKISLAASTYSEETRKSRYDRTGEVADFR